MNLGNDDLREYLQSFCSDESSFPPAYFGDRPPSSFYADLEVVGPKGRLPWEEIRESALTEPDRPLRVLIQGNAGFGKSGLLKATARKLAEDALQQLNEGGHPSDIHVPVLADAPAVIAAFAKAAGSSPTLLSTALERCLAQRGYPTSALPILRTPFDSSNRRYLWLLLDNLDRVSLNSDNEWLFGSLRNWSGHFVIASRPHGYAQLIATTVDTYTLAPLSPEQIEGVVARWFGGRGDSSLIRALRSQSVIAELASIPLFLSLLCWRFARGVATPLATRLELVQGVLEDLLSYTYSPPVVSDEGNVERLMSILGEVACSFFCECPRSEEIELRWLSRKLTKMLRKSDDVSPEDARSRAATVLEELSRRRVLVSSSQNGSTYAFPHFIFLEFLVAYHLSQLLEEVCLPRGSAKRDDDLLTSSEAARKLVRAKTWDPTWATVIQFLSGMLNDPGALIRLLAEKSKDDCFRHRLMLAGECLAEIPPCRLERIPDLAAGVSKEILDIWFTTSPSHRPYYHLDPALRSIAHACREQVSSSLLLKLKGASRPAQVSAAHAITVAGLPACATGTVDKLFQLLHHCGGEIAGAAYWAITTLGDLGSTEVELKAAHWLSSDDAEARQLGIELLMALRRGAGTAAIVDQFSALLRTDAAVSEYFVGVAEEVGTALATEDNVNTTMALLDCEDPRGRRAAIALLSGVLWEAVPDTFTERLVAFVADPNPEVCAQAIEACVSHAEFCWNEELDGRVLELLFSQDDMLVNAAANAIYQLGILADNPNVQARLEKLLEEEDPLGISAAWAIARIFPHSCFMSSLDNALLRGTERDIAGTLLWTRRWIQRWTRNDMGEVREDVVALVQRHAVAESQARRAGAAKAIRQLPDFCDDLQDTLIQLLDDDNTLVHQAAAETFTRVKWPIPGKVANRLMELAEGNDRETAVASIAAIAGADQHDITEAHIERLAKLCQSADLLVSKAALGSIPSMGIRVTANQPLMRFVFETCFNNSSDRRLTMAACGTLGQFMSLGLRVFPSSAGNRTWTFQHVSELSRLEVASLGGPFGLVLDHNTGVLARQGFKESVTLTTLLQLALIEKVMMAPGGFVSAEDIKNVWREHGRVFNVSPGAITQQVSVVNGKLKELSVKLESETASPGARRIVDTSTSASLSNERSK